VDRDLIRVLDLVILAALEDDEDEGRLKVPLARRRMREPE
jgi:hypothetical protein